MTNYFIDITKYS